MMHDLQKASMWKRISAFLFDIILLATVAVGLAFVLSSVLGYERQVDQLEQCYSVYETEYAIDFDISAEDYAALTDEQLAVYDEALAALSADQTFMHTYSLLINLTLIIITFSILLACLIFEFLIPLLFGNGQTLGKKIFGIGVMRADGVRLSPMLLFVRTVLGKYTVEIMLPVLIVIMIYFGYVGILGTALLVLLALIQFVLLLVTPARTPLHDKLAQTVTVDFASQMIFDSLETLLEYKKRLQEERANAPEQQ
ncbi:MAG: RDD family protein [Clostridia bacterium]|nr:RDD family protein [Clostridia bacterium]